jgi:BirA family biotin operon repressor/biotin-[acetyl-CoA-carboxylase] ligase
MGAMMLHRYGTVDSTQTVARGLADQGAPHGTVVLAEAQTAGRGRLDRRWQSAPGENLTFSVVLRPTCPVREAPLLTLGAAAGLAVALDVRVKWPNDLVDREGRKLGGLLAEMETAGDRVRYVILGLGLNVNQTAFPDLPNATSLATLFGPQDREDVLDRAAAAILAWAEHPGRLDLWRQRAHTLGKRVRVGGVEGVATHLRDDGALVVDGVAVTTGEIDQRP